MRDLGTQKEIMKQYELSKKEIVGRLRKELDTVEDRFLKIINQNNMVGEDYRMRAALNFERMVMAQVTCKELQEELDIKRAKVAKYEVELPKVEFDLETTSMSLEDFSHRCIKAHEKIEKMRNDIGGATTIVKEKDAVIADKDRQLTYKSGQIKDMGEKLSDAE